MRRCPACGARWLPFWQQWECGSYGGNGPIYTTLKCAFGEGRLAGHIEALLLMDTVLDEHQKTVTAAEGERIWRQVRARLARLRRAK